MPTPGNYSTVINKGATWGPLTVSYTRDGSPVIPDDAVMYFRSPSGTLLETLTGSIDGGGVITIPSLSDSQTEALDWSYGNLLLQTTEGSTVVDLLAGNVTVVNRSE